MYKEDNKRDQNLDIMKGIGILLVVFGHVFYHSEVIYQFHMPLFFILSGAAMTYSLNGYSFSKKIKTLMVPYIVFSVICFVYWALLESKFRPAIDGRVFGGWLNGNIKIQQFLNIFTAINSKSAFVYNVVLWFLPCLFMAELMYAKVKGGKKEWIVNLFAIITCYLLVRNSNGFLWCLGESLVAVPLLSLGFHVYQPLMKFLKKNVSRTVVIGCSCAILFVVLYILLQPHTNMVDNVISNEFYIMAILGSMSVITLSIILHKIKFRGGIAYLGRNSLIVMCVHEPLKRIILQIMSKVLSMPTGFVRDEIGMSILATCITVVVCIPIIEIINRRFSWMIGKF